MESAPLSHSQRVRENRNSRANDRDGHFATLSATASITVADDEGEISQKEATEARPPPIYALLLARSDGRLGPRFRGQSAHASWRAALSGVRAPRQAS
jgi:hypothetical protein